MLKSFFGKFREKKADEEKREEQILEEEFKEDTFVIPDAEEKSDENAPTEENTFAEELSSYDDEAEELVSNFLEEEEAPEEESKEEDIESGAAVIDEQIEEEETLPQSLEDYEEGKDEDIAKTKDAEEEKKGFFSKLVAGLSKTKSVIAGRVDTILLNFKTVDEELFEELEEALIMADIGVDTSLYIIDELRQRVKRDNIKEVSEIKSELKDIINDILKGTDNELHIESKPAVIMVIGVNGVGKTTSIGKLAKSFTDDNKKVVLAAADTFRAAAIDQLEIWAKRSGADIVKHQEGSDPSAVIYDAIAAAKARGADVVICDTAGRLHNKKHLMDELAKSSRVIERETGRAPDEFLLVLDGSTGQNALIQAREFANVSPITGVILTKLDGTAKGGAVIALAKEQGIGVKFIGVGEGIYDLQKFVPEEFAEAIF